MLKKGVYSVHLFEANVERHDSFRFTLPAHFLGINGNQLIQFVIEYGIAPDTPECLVFNAWCNYPGANTRFFLFSDKVLNSEDPIDAIMNYLNDSDNFSNKVYEFANLNKGKKDLNNSESLQHEAAKELIDILNAYVRRSVLMYRESPAIIYSSFASDMKLTPLYSEIFELVSYLLSLVPNNIGLQSIVRWEKYSLGELAEQFEKLLNGQGLDDGVCEMLAGDHGDFTDEQLFILAFLSRVNDLLGASYNAAGWVPDNRLQIADQCLLEMISSVNGSNEEDILEIKPQENPSLELALKIFVPFANFLIEVCEDILFLDSDLETSLLCVCNELSG